VSEQEVTQVVTCDHHRREMKEHPETKHIAARDERGDVSQGRSDTR